MLFAAARDDHIKFTIQPALAEGKWVICDRFADSTRVYQGILGRVDQRFINALERVSVGGLLPDLTLVLDVPAEMGLKRAAGRRRGQHPDRFEAEELDFHQKLRAAYQALVKREPKRCVLVDARAAKKVVAKRIWQVVSKKFELAPPAVALEQVAT